MEFGRILSIPKNINLSCVYNTVYLYKFKTELQLNISFFKFRAIKTKRVQDSQKKKSQGRSLSKI